MSRPIFWKSKEKTDDSFLDAVKRITKITFSSVIESKNWLSNNGYWTNYPLAVGDKAFGGIVGYIYKPTDSGYIDGEIHGIIVSENDISDTKTWGCLETSTSGITIGTGLQNTLDIINDCEELDIAARFCYDLTSGGYNDWFLPSYLELYELMLNKNLIGGFLNAWYWSSSENISNKNQAWVVKGSEPVLVASNSKGYLGHLTRAVRYF